MFYILLITIWLNGKDTPVLMPPVATKTEDVCMTLAEKGLTALLTDKETAGSIRAVDYSCVKVTPKTTT